MTNSEILKKLKLINEVKPDRQWLADNRTDLLLKIRENCSESKQQSWKKVPVWLKTNLGFLLDIMLPHRFINTFGRPAIISLVGAITLVGGMTTIGAAQNTVPGNVLYPIKIASENTQLFLTANVESKTRLEMEFAGRRIKELNKLAAADKLTPHQLEEKVNKVTAKLKENINTVNIHLARLNQEGEASKALEVAKDIDNKVAEYTIALNKINEVSTVQVKVAEALNQVEEASNKALEVIVANYNEVENSISESEIAEKLNSKIALATNEIDVDEETGQVFQDAQELVKKGEFVAALSKITEGKDIIKEIREKMNAEKENKEEVALPVDSQENEEGDDKSAIENPSNTADEQESEDEDVEVLGEELEEGQDVIEEIKEEVNDVDNNNTEL